MKVVSRHVEWLHWLGKLPICSVVKGDCYTFQRQCNDQIFQKKRLTWLCRSKNIIHTHVITSCFGRTVYEYRLQQSAIMYSVCCSNIIVGIKSPLELFSVVLLQNCITLPCPAIAHAVFAQTKPSLTKTAFQSYLSIKIKSIPIRSLGQMWKYFSPVSKHISLSVIFVFAVMYVWLDKPSSV